MGHSREESGSCRGPREQERPGRGWRPTQEDKLLSELLSGATPATSASLHEGAAPGPAPSERPVSLTPSDAPATLRGAGAAGPSPGAPLEPPCPAHPACSPPPLKGRWGYPEAPARGTLPGGEPGGDEGRGPGSERGRTQRWRRQRPAAPGRSAPPAEHRHTGAEPSGAHLPRPGGSCATPPLRAKEQGGPALKAQGQDWGARGGGRWPAAPWGSERQRPRGGEGDAPSPELRWGPRGAEETLRGEGRVSPGPPPPLPAGAPHKLTHRRPLLQPSAHFGSTGFEQATHAV